MVCANTEQSRELFEAFASDNGKWMKAIERDEYGNYRLLTTNAGWLWWQAATAAREPLLARIAELEAQLSAIGAGGVEVVKKVTKPSINWEHVRDEYKFLAQDVTGSAWLYIEEPTPDEDYWCAEAGVYVNANSYASYIPGNCDWKDSLVKRPD